MDAETRERIAVARRWLELRPDRTHWQGCWRDHGGCASLICLDELEVAGSGLDALVPELARLRAALATAEAERDEHREAWMFMRDCILNEMGPLEVNDVLSIIDSFYPDEAALSDADGAGESEEGR